MRKLLTAEQARRAEETAAGSGITATTLMGRAGEAVALEASRIAPVGELLVVVGGGNNGGDGWVAARRLAASGRSVRVVSLADPGRLAAEAAEAASGAISDGVPWMMWDGNTALGSPSLVIDALLGFGASGAPREPYAAAIAAINALRSPVLAVDLPSGVDSDTGDVAGEAVRADVTVTLTAPKLGLMTLPGAGLAGRLVIAEIGVPVDALADIAAPELWDPVDLAPLLPVPAPGVHKSSRGRLLIIAGSGGMTGAAILAASSAARSGAGYVTLAVPESVADLVDAAVVPAVTWSLPEGEGRAMTAEAATPVLEAAGTFDAMVIGPGVAVTEGAMTAVRRIVEGFEGPVLVDAGGLSAFAGDTGALSGREGPTVMTPHPGELGRLLGMSTREVESNRLKHAAALSGPETVCVLKGYRTVVSGQGRQAVSDSGNPGMATAGSGDVLSGIVGALLAQRLAPFEASVLGVHLHGMAGDAAAEAMTSICMNAEDIRDGLPSAVARLMREGHIDGPGTGRGGTRADGDR